MKGREESAKPKRAGAKGPHAKARAVVKAIVFAAIVVGLCVHTGFGTYSSAGIGFVASICPLGALEGLFGAWAFVPRLVIGLVAMLLVVFVFGRAFCGWVCPVPPVAAFFKTKRRRERETREREEAGRAALERYRCAACGGASAVGDEVAAGGKVVSVGAGGAGVAGASIDGAADASAAHDVRAVEACPDSGSRAPGMAKPRLDSRHAVLCGALGSAAIFGFPVFCLICPIGLTCASVVLLVRLLGIGELSWGLFLFPAVLVLELVVLKDYCGKICPVAALMSLVARASRTFRPKANAQACLRDNGHAACHVCASACPEHIDPCAGFGSAALNECTRCGRCADACPEHAISFPVLPGK